MEESGDWRAPSHRQRIVNKIMDTLKRHLPFTENERLQELKKVAERVEHEIYTSTTTQPEYVRMICFMMLSMETRLQNLRHSNSAANGGDWQEEVYQKLKAMKDLYLQDLTGQTGNPNGEDGQEEVCQKIKVGDAEEDEKSDEDEEVDEEGDSDGDEDEEEDKEGDSDGDEDEDREYHNMERPQQEQMMRGHERPVGYDTWPSYAQISYDHMTRQFEEARIWRTRYFEEARLRTQVDMYSQELERNRRFAYEEQLRHHHDYHEGLPYIETPPPVDYSTLPPYTAGSPKLHYPQSKPSRWLPKHITSSFSSGEGSSEAIPRQIYEIQTKYNTLMESIFGPPCRSH